ncbi:MAG: hypothetical protein SGILL_000413, partial [Bacillariaceae sp.]
MDLEETQLTDEQKEQAYLAAGDSDCDKFWIDFCFNEAHRYCYINQEQSTELCGDCLPGSFDFKTLCVTSTAYDLLSYIEEFAPVYLREIPEEE